MWNSFLRFAADFKDRKSYFAAGWLKLRVIDLSYQLFIKYSGFLTTIFCSPLTTEDKGIIQLNISSKCQMVLLLSEIPI